MGIVRRSSVLLSLIVMLTLNTLAIALPLNNVTTKELSDAIPTLFVPAGYVFSIWSLIYLALIGYAVYQALPATQQQSALQGMAWLFVLNAFANGGWIVLWHYRYVGLSVIVMLVILVTLILIYRRLDIGRRRVSWPQYWLTHFPFSLYLGWISVATMANISAALYVYHWNGWGIAPAIWSATLLCAATALTLTMLLVRRDVVFAGVIIWAVVGIALNFSDIPVIAYTAWIGVAVVMVGIVGVIIKNKKHA